MKHTILVTTLLLSICGGTLPQMAQAEETPAAATTAKKARKAKKATSVAKAFKDVTFFKAEEGEEGKAEEETGEEPKPISPNKRAKYYIYLSSASWCAPCKALMPEVVKQYKQMKKKKVEVILISFDRTEEDARNYLKNYKAEFCGVMMSDGDKLPGYKQASGIPHAIIVDKKGKVINAGGGAAVIENWKLDCK